MEICKCTMWLGREKNETVKIAWYWVSKTFQNAERNSGYEPLESLELSQTKRKKNAK